MAINLSSALAAEPAAEVEDRTFKYVDKGYRPPIHLVNDDKGRRYESIKPRKIELESGKIKEVINKYRSVTGILGSLSTSGILGWKQAEIRRHGDDIEAGLAYCEKHSTESINVGNAMHYIIERYLKGEPRPIHGNRAEDIPGLAHDPFELFKQVKPFLNRLDNIRGIEIPLYSSEIKVAGTSDVIAEFDGHLAVIDHKNSRRPKSPYQVRQYIVQEALYATMWEELVGERPELLITNIANWDGTDRQYMYNFTPELQKYCVLKFKELMGAEKFFDNLADIQEYIPRRPIRIQPPRKRRSAKK